jgi:hypothetical protein
LILLFQDVAVPHKQTGGKGEDNTYYEKIEYNHPLKTLKCYWFATIPDEQKGPACIRIEPFGCG